MPAPERPVPAGCHTRLQPLPPMRLDRAAQAGLVALRVLLLLTAAMSVFAAAHAPVA